MADRDALQTELAGLEHRAKTEPHNADRLKARIKDVKSVLGGLPDDGPADVEEAVPDHADVEDAVSRGRARGR